MGIDAKEIGQRIKGLRKERGITQEQLAAMLGVTVNYLSRIEPGIRRASLDLLVDIALLFDTTLDYLVLGRR
jgi:transcriptional regulator with XRE-family HTH domain